MPASRGEASALPCPPGAKRIIGVDPGLNITGWGVVDALPGGEARFVACGVLKTSASRPLASRLAELGDGVEQEAKRWGAHEAAMEQTFVNGNAASSLRLGHARGALMAALARSGLSVAEFAPTEIKKNIAGNGRAEKHQVAAMVKLLLGGAAMSLTPDSADALAAALCRARVPSWAEA